MYSKTDLHPGLICLDSELLLDADRQQERFRRALAELGEMKDLIN